MLAQFTVHPLGETHFSKDVAQMMKILDEAGVEYCLGPMSTGVEGNWKDVMSAIHRCHEAMLEQNPRVVTTITIDDRKEQPHHLDEVVSIVEKQLGHTARQIGLRRRVSDLQ